VTGLARDTQGNLLVARSGTELQQLDTSGALVWSQPYGQLVATDERDHVFVAGKLTSALTVAPGLTLDPADGSAYVVELDHAGEGARVLYATAIAAVAAMGDPHGSEAAEVLSFAVDAESNAVVSGTGLGTVLLDAAGRVRWSKSFYGHAAFDACGNLLLAGELVGSTDFGAGPHTSAGGSDVFLVELSRDGEQLFSRRFGDAGANQRAEAIAVDGQGDLLLAGVFDGSLDFGVGALTLDAHACPAEAWCKTAGFVAKLDSEGNALFSRSLGPMRSLAGLASDSQDQPLVSCRLPGGVSPFEIPLLLKLDAQGTELWRRSEWPASGIGAGHDVISDASDNVLWSVSALPAPGGDEQPFIAELSP
jgi:hypothetical protein